MEPNDNNNSEMFDDVDQDDDYSWDEDDCGDTKNWQTGWVFCINICWMTEINKDPPSNCKYYLEQVLNEK